MLLWYDNGPLSADVSQLHSRLCLSGNWTTPASRLSNTTRPYVLTILLCKVWLWVSIDHLNCKDFTLFPSPDSRLNYALSKPTQQSTTYGNSSLAVDGDVGTSSHTYEEEFPFWMVDLQRMVHGPDQRNPWIKDQLWNDLLSTILHLQLPNFGSCGRDKPSHTTQNLVTVGVKL